MDQEPSTNINRAHHHLYAAFDRQSYLNDGVLDTLHSFTSSSSAKLFDLEKISMINETPIAQWIVDAYYQLVVRQNWPIELFMQKCSFFTNMDEQYSHVRRIIHTHLSGYIQHVHFPLHKDTFSPSTNHTNDNDDDDDEELSMQQEAADLDHIEALPIKHDLKRIIHYLHEIQPRLPHERPLKDSLFPCRQRQMDIIFVAGCIEGISSSYFERHGMQFVKWNHSDYLSKLIRDYDAKKVSSKRCVMLVMAKDDDMEHDEVYLFEPAVTRQTLAIRHDIHSYCELPWIVNTKANPLPNVPLSEHHPLYVSIHVHDGAELAQRVYVSYEASNGMWYGTRLFANDMISVLAPFCKHVDDMYGCLTMLKDVEFTDDGYRRFVRRYFGELADDGMFDQYRYFETVRFVEEVKSLQTEFEQAVSITLAFVDERCKHNQFNPYDIIETQAAFIDHLVENGMERPAATVFTNRLTGRLKLPRQQTAASVVDAGSLNRPDLPGQYAYVSTSALALKTNTASSNTVAVCTEHAEASISPDAEGEDMEHDEDAMVAEIATPTAGEAGVEEIDAAEAGASTTRMSAIQIN